MSPPRSLVHCIEEPQCPQNKLSSQVSTYKERSHQFIQQDPNTLRGLCGASDGLAAQGADTTHF